MQKKLIQFGAGNIGRSFIGQVFSKAGYEVVFVDIDERLIQLLNQRQQYRVILKQTGTPDQEIVVSPVRAINAKDHEAVAQEIATATTLCTSVGKNALPHILPSIAEGIKQRFREPSNQPLDIIFAENIRDVAHTSQQTLQTRLPDGFPLENRVGFIESSIGKMVPIMKREDLEKDPLWVFAEPYNTLIIDRVGFRGTLPESPNIKPVNNITAYVDRKLFIHNLGHAAAAYIGYINHPDAITIAQIMEDETCKRIVRDAMTESAVALNRAYPDDLLMPDLMAHIDDLLLRFANHALGDTLFRVGRDLPRKLHVNDRLLGAMLLAEKHQCPNKAIAQAAAAAFRFRATDENGQMAPSDIDFLTLFKENGPEAALAQFAGLTPNVTAHQAIFDKIENAIQMP